MFNGLFVHPGWIALPVTRFFLTPYLTFLLSLNSMILSLLTSFCAIQRVICRTCLCVLSYNREETDISRMARQLSGVVDYESSSMPLKPHIPRALRQRSPNFIVQAFHSYLAISSLVSEIQFLRLHHKTPSRVSSHSLLSIALCRRLRPHSRLNVHQWSSWGCNGRLTNVAFWPLSRPAILKTQCRTMGPQPPATILNSNPTSPMAVPTQATGTVKTLKASLYPTSNTVLEVLRFVARSTTRAIRSDWISRLVAGRQYRPMVTAVPLLQILQGPKKPRGWGDFNGDADKMDQGSQRPTPS